MSTKSYASLFMVCLILCMTTFALLGGTPAISSAQPASGTHDSLGSGNLQYLRDIGPFDQNTTIVNTRATRVVAIQDYGLLSVNDTIMVHNNGSLTVSYWTFYLASDVYSALRYLAAYGNGTVLDVDVGTPFESFFGMRVDFARLGGLHVNSSISVTLIQEYSGLVKPSGSTDAKVYFYKFLTSPYTTLNCTTSVVLPQDAVTSQPVTMKGINVLPFNCTRLGSSVDGGYLCTLSGGGQTLLDVSVDRAVEITVDGFLSVMETHRVENLGPQGLITVRFKLPLWPIPGSLEARDSSGEMGIVSSSNGYTTVVFRYSIPVNESFTYYVSYRASIDSYRSFEDGLYVIRMSPVTVFNCSISSEITTIVFPPHYQVYNASGSQRQVQAQGDNIVVTYSFQNVTLLNTPSIELRYAEDVAETFQRPMIISFGIFAIGLLYICARKIFPRGAAVVAAREAEEKVRGLAATVKEFCSNYEEKTALTIEIEKLAEDRRKGRVSKRAFVERLQLARRRIATLTNTINEEKKKLIPASKRYASIIRQLDTYEEERENARASLENLELRRRQGKVSGDVYNSLKYENTKKIEKATAGIDSLVVQLRQETL